MTSGGGPQGSLCRRASLIQSPLREQVPSLIKMPLLNGGELKTVLSAEVSDTCWLLVCEHPENMGRRQTSQVESLKCNSRISPIAISLIEFS